MPGKAEIYPITSGTNVAAHLNLLVVPTNRRAGRINRSAGKKVDRMRKDLQKNNGRKGGSSENELRGKDARR